MTAIELATYVVSSEYFPSDVFQHNKPTNKHRYNRASIVYVSTISVLPNELSLARDSESEIAGDMSFLSSAGGYVQSKWVAEVRLRSAVKMGAIRGAKILRPDSFHRMPKQDPQTCPIGLCDSFTERFY